MKKLLSPLLTQQSKETYCKFRVGPCLTRKFTIRLMPSSSDDTPPAPYAPTMGSSGGLFSTMSHGPSRPYSVRGKAHVVRPPHSLFYSLSLSLPRSASLTLLGIKNPNLGSPAEAHFGTQATTLLPCSCKNHMRLACPLVYYLLRYLCTTQDLGNYCRTSFSASITTLAGCNICRMLPIIHAP